ncbi:UbiA family prenyltransferase, partial [Salmonella enterica]
MDKINKPYLPLASGKLSITSGVIIVASCLIMSFGSAWIMGSWPVIWSLLACSTLWTCYSANVPLLRWKRRPVLAAMCFLIPWAFVFPIAFFFHIQTFVFKRPAMFPRSLNFVMVFMSLYSIGIALFKDLPDIEGDKK